MSEREYLAQVTIGGHVPRLNQVFEELGVKYGDREVPKKFRNVVVLKVDSCKAKAKKRKVGSQWPSQKKAKFLGDGESSKVVAVVNLEGEGNACEACANSDLGSQDLSPLSLVDTN